MSYKKEIIILAVSRKNSNYCVAGKEILGGKIGSWIRPVGHSERGELTISDIKYADNKIPAPFDIVEIEFECPKPEGHQTENHLIKQKSKWVKKSTFNNDLNMLRDNPTTLWINSSDSTLFCKNERVHENRISDVSSSLCFIKPENAILEVVCEEMRIRIRAKFNYKDVEYRIWVTDPVYERQFQSEGKYTVRGEVYFCVSLGGLFHSYYYKLVAGIFKV